MNGVRWHTAYSHHYAYAWLRQIRNENSYLIPSHAIIIIIIFFSLPTCSRRGVAARALAQWSFPFWCLNRCVCACFDEARSTLVSNWSKNERKKQLHMNFRSEFFRWRCHGSQRERVTDVFLTTYSIYIEIFLFLFGIDRAFNCSLIYVQCSCTVYLFSFTKMPRTFFSAYLELYSPCTQTICTRNENFLSFVFHSFFCTSISLEHSV